MEALPMERPAPLLDTNPRGRLRAVRQLAILREIARHNRRGQYPTRYLVGRHAMPGGRGTRGYPYVAVDKLISYGLVRDRVHKESKQYGSKLEVTDAGKRELSYWDAHPIEAAEWRKQ